MSEQVPAEQDAGSEGLASTKLIGLEVMKGNIKAANVGSTPTQEEGAVRRPFITML